MLKKGYECTADTWIRTNPSINNPCFLQSSQRKLDLYYPFEVINAMVNQHEKLGEYESLDMNVFTSVEYLENIIIPKTSSTLFRYRVRELIGTELRYVDPGKPHQIAEKFTFEINLMNIFDFTDKSCLYLRSHEDLMLYKYPGNRGVGSEGVLAQKLHDKALDFI